MNLGMLAGMFNTREHILALHFTFYTFNFDIVASARDQISSTLQDSESISKDLMTRRNHAST